MPGLGRRVVVKKRTGARPRIRSRAGYRAAIDAPLSVRRAREGLRLGSRCAGGLREPRLVGAPESSGQDLAAEAVAAIEVAAGLRTGLVDRAEAGHRVQGHAGAVALLVHAARAGVLDDEVLRHPVTCAQFDHQMTAPATAGAGREIGVGLQRKYGRR